MFYKTTIIVIVTYYFSYHYPYLILNLGYSFTELDNRKVRLYLIFSNRGNIEEYHLVKINSFLFSYLLPCLKSEILAERNFGEFIELLKNPHFN